MYQMIFRLLMIKDNEIAPDSAGAKKWIWLDRGEIKLSARIFQYFAVPLVFSIVFSIAGIVSLFMDPSLFGWIGLGWFSVVLTSSIFLITYNRFVLKMRSTKMEQEN